MSFYIMRCLEHKTHLSQSFSVHLLNMRVIIFMINYVLKGTMMKWILVRNYCMLRQFGLELAGLL